MLRTYFRGHAAYYEPLTGFWRYCDTGEVVAGAETAKLNSRENMTRACPFCDRKPTPEGYDACIGFLPGVYSACCGHGVTPSYVVWENGVVTDGLGVDGRRDVVSLFGGLVRTEAASGRLG